MAENHDTVIYVDNGNNCIFRVPKVLQKQNPDAYTPCVVSIGPFHHRKKGSEDEGKDDDKEEGKDGKDKKYFQLLERMKHRYLNEVLSCMNTDLEGLTKKVVELSDQKNDGPIEFEKGARDFYAEKLDYESKYFQEMMIVDGCFLIQLFRKCTEVQPRVSYDPLFDMDCMFHFLCHDLLLLENQLPWFVLETLYSLILAYSGGRGPSLSILILDAFKHLPSLKQYCQSYRDHLLQCHPHKQNWRGHGYANVLHILDLIRDSIVDQTENTFEQAFLDPDVHGMYTATALSKAGITCRGVKTENIMDIQFQEGWLFCNGVLKIPQLNVGMLTESLFRNLIAFEQCYNGISNEIYNILRCVYG